MTAVAKPVSPKPPALSETQPKLGTVNEERAVSPEQWIGFFAMVFGMFLALLDIQIVASSLEQIQAGLSTTRDEINWVQTAYLIPADGLFVEANFKETQIGQMRPEQPVEIRVDAYPDHIFEGTVDSFAPASGSEFSLLPPENATGNFTKIVRRVPVKILFRPGADLSRLRPGLSSVVKVRVR